MGEPGQMIFERLHIQGMVSPPLIRVMVTLFLSGWLLLTPCTTGMDDFSLKQLVLVILNNFIRALNPVLWGYLQGYPMDIYFDGSMFVL